MPHNSQSNHKKESPKLSASILQKNWIIAKQLEQGISTASKYAKGLLLDAGCGDKPYRHLFAKKVDRHIGIDMGSSLVGNNLDIYGHLLSLPFANCTFETVLCTEALQYVPEPSRTMQEFYRVLQPGGVLILTTTQMWHITNAPYDCFRFTEYGLKYLAKTTKLYLLFLFLICFFIKNLIRLYVDEQMNSDTIYI